MEACGGRDIDVIRRCARSRLGGVRSILGVHYRQDRWHLIWQAGFALFRLS